MANDPEIDPVATLVGQPLDPEDRVSLERLQQFLTTAIYQSAEQTHAMGRWLLASLLALNGGALLAAFGAPDLDTRVKGWAGAWWAIGILLALLTVFLSMHAGRRGIALCADSITRVMLCLNEGAWKDIRFEEGQAEINRWTNRMIWAGALSAVCFVVGVIIVGAEMLAG